MDHRALILLRHRDLLTPVDLLTLFFDLLKCPDKTLRKFLRDHIISDIKGVNSKGKDVRLNTALQNFMFKVRNGKKENLVQSFKIWFPFNLIRLVLWYFIQKITMERAIVFL